MSKYVLGVDCGGTSTKVLAADFSGRILGSGRGGPANYAVDGYEQVMQTVRNAVLEALREGGISWDAVLAEGAVLAAGVSGTTIPGSTVKLEQGWRELGFRQVAVTHDAFIALMGALSGQDGAIVISGTGSIGFGRWAGRYVQMGGWGYILGDEGSSFWITKQVVRRLCQGRDGMAERDVELEQAVLEHFQVQSVDEVVQIVYQVPINRGYLGSLTPVIVKLAQGGNASSQAIIKEAGRELGRLAGAVVDKLNSGGRPCRVGACGGVFAAGEVILEPMQAALAEKAPYAQVTLPDFDPVVGALLVGYDKLGITPAQILPSLAEGLKERQSHA